MRIQDLKSGHFGGKQMLSPRLATLLLPPPPAPPPSPYNQAVNKKLNLFLVLMMTGVDKCPVSRLINGVDTIKIEDSGNARTPKYYKVLLSLFFF